MNSKYFKKEDTNEEGTPGSERSELHKKPTVITVIPRGSFLYVLGDTFGGRRIVQKAPFDDF